MKKSLMPNALDDLDIAKIQKDIETIRNFANNDVSKVVSILKSDNTPKGNILVPKKQCFNL